MVEQMKELGLFGATIGPEYGGLGLSATHLRQDRHAHFVGLDVDHRHLQLASDAGARDREIRHAGSRSRAGCRSSRSGEIRGGLALTEPDAGTDLQGIRMTARRDGDHYVINGTKTWITNGVEGSCFALLVKTDPDAEPRHKGMSLFIAPKRQGFTVGRKLREARLQVRSIPPN